ncbi:hypothetical protein Lepto7375DRAFT_0919 [Leptolyngbya sp. PCC 7375]|nr:hypothetical protein Lepto7375DRAFT_0919 [Leptolyngbya sp. PCC 7375]
MKLSGREKEELVALIISAYDDGQNAYARFGNFLNFKLDKSINVVGGSGPLDVVVTSVVQNAVSNGYIEVLISAFSSEKPDRVDIQQFCQSVLSKLLPRPENITKQKWSSLFNHLQDDDYTLELQRAFEDAFSEVMGYDYSESPPFESVPKDIGEIQNLLEVWSNNKKANKGPTLAVRFVDFAIEKIRNLMRQSKRINPIKKDVSPLREWRNEIAATFDVPDWSPSSPADPTLSEKTVSGHLVVSLKEHGGKLMAFPELYLIEGEDPEKRVKSFEASPTPRCSLEDIWVYISEWILLAESAMCEANELATNQVIVELFLPINYIIHDISNWILQDEDEDDVTFGRHRPFIVRSIYRATSKTSKVIKAKIKNKWPILVNEKGEFYTNHFEQGFTENEKTIIPTKLNKNEVIGVQLTFKEGLEQDNQIALLKDIRKSPALIAVWGVESPDGKQALLQSKFQDLVESDVAYSFSKLANRYRELSEELPTLVKNIRLVCECPYRWPKTLPDTTDGKAMKSDRKLRGEVL